MYNSSEDYLKISQLLITHLHQNDCTPQYSEDREKKYILSRLFSYKQDIHFGFSRAV